MQYFEKFQSLFKAFQGVWKGVIFTASINIKKLHGATETKRRLRHCDRECRLADGHANTDIDKSMTGKNFQYKMSYEETCERYDRRTEECFSSGNTRKRSDLVTCLGIEIPAPEELPDEQFRDWAKDVDCIMKDRFGRNNILASYGHRDEKHEYVNTDGNTVMSRNHLHFYVIPDVGEGKLCAKQFMDRKAIIGLNNAIQEMTESKYHMLFMDGTGKKSRDNVESLKCKSQKRELKATQKALEATQKALEDSQKALEEVQAEHDKLKAENDALSSEVAKKERFRGDAERISGGIRNLPDISNVKGYGE